MLGENQNSGYCKGHWLRRNLMGTYSYKDCDNCEKTVAVNSFNGIYRYFQLAYHKKLKNIKIILKFYPTCLIIIPIGGIFKTSKFILTQKQQIL